MQNITTLLAPSSVVLLFNKAGWVLTVINCHMLRMICTGFSTITQLYFWKSELQSEKRILHLKAMGIMWSKLSRLPVFDTWCKENIWSTRCGPQQRVLPPHNSAQPLWFCVFMARGGVGFPMYLLGFYGYMLLQTEVFFFLQAYFKLSHNKKNYLSFQCSMNIFFIISRKQLLPQ